jgi:hypothetical protein
MFYFSVGALFINLPIQLPFRASAHHVHVLDKYSTVHKNVYWCTILFSATREERTEKRLLIKCQDFQSGESSKL